MSLRHYRTAGAAVVVAGFVATMALVGFWPGSGEAPARWAAAQSDRVVIPADHLPAAEAAASARERPLLADGVVTREEYAAAVDGTVACLQEHGFQVGHPTAISHGLYGDYGQLGPSGDGAAANSRGVIEYVATGGAGTVEENGAAVAACKQGSAVVERLWQQHLAPTDAERQSARNAIGSCMRGLGHEVPVAPSDADLTTARGTLGSPENLQFVQDLGRCDMQQAQEPGGR